MKALNIILVLLMINSIITNAQNIIEEKFDTYASGQYMAEVDTEGVWTTWNNNPGSSEDITTSNKFALSDSISGFVTTGADAVLKLGTFNSGLYKVSLNVLIEAESMGYFNILQAFGDNSAWGLDVYFDGTGLINLIANTEEINVGTFEHEKWINFECIIDLDNDWADVLINNNYVHGYQWTKGSQNNADNVNQIEAINFWAPTGASYVTKMHVDNISFDYYTHLPKPQNLSAVINDVNNIDLTWEAPEGDAPQGYIIKRNNTVINTNIITTTSFSDQELYLGDYTYEVFARYESGLSKASNSVELGIEGGVERENILLEVSMNTGIVGCVGTMLGTNDLIEKHKNVAAINYHVGDEFEITESGERYTYYGDDITPMSYFDGLNTIKGGLASSTNYPYYLPEYIKTAGVKSDYSMDISFKSLVDNIFEVTVNIKKEWIKADKNITLNLAFVESNISKYWQSQTKLNHVLRAMQFTVPDMAFTNEASANFTIELPDNSFNPAYSQFIAFIQDNNKKVHQTVKKSILNSVDSISASIEGNTVNLKWEAPVNNSALQITGYDIYRDSELIFEDYAYTTFKESGLEYNTEYEYCINAVYNNEIRIDGICTSIKTDFPENINNTKVKMISAFPNPAKATLTIKANEPIRFLQLTSITGKTVYTKNNAEQETIVPTQQIENGMYILIIENYERNIVTKKVIIEN